MIQSGPLMKKKHFYLNGALAKNKGTAQRQATAKMAARVLRMFKQGMFLSFESSMETFFRAPLHSFFSLVFIQLSSNEDPLTT